MDDLADTDFKCSTNKVSTFTLKTAEVHKIANKHQSLRTVLKDLEAKLAGKTIALDYIIHNNESSAEEYDKRLKNNQLRVKFKDAIMQLWSKHKDSNKKPTIGELVK